jgi:hypothetical protein
MGETKILEICVKLLQWVLILSWWEDWWLDVKKVQESLSTRMEGLLKCTEEWQDVNYLTNLVGANMSKQEKTGG